VGEDGRIVLQLAGDVVRSLSPLAGRDAEGVPQPLQRPLQGHALLHSERVSVHRDRDLATRMIVRHQAPRLVGAARHAGPAADTRLRAGADDDLAAKAAVGAAGSVYGADVECSHLMQTRATPRWAVSFKTAFVRRSPLALDITTVNYTALVCGLL
jgi:hypothetical protein